MWQPGRLHVIDISALDSMRRVSTVRLTESDICDSAGNKRPKTTDAVFKGNLVYSVWLAQGLKVFDVTDPANPVEVGKLISPQTAWPWLSDLAMYGDHVLATTVWAPGLYILR